MTRTVVVARNWLHSHAHSEDYHYHDEDVAVGNAVSAHCHIAAVFYELFVQNRDNACSRHIHKERTQSYQQNVFEDIAFRLESVTTEADERVAFQEMQHRKERSERHRDGGSPSRACYSHIENEDKQGVETDVEHRTRHENYHRLVGIARRTHQRDEIERQGRQEHSRKHDDHVLTGVGDGFGCCTKGEQDSVEEDIRKQHHQSAQNDGENDAVAENILRPVDIFLTQNYRHPRPCSNTYQSAESVYYINNR